LHRWAYDIFVDVMVVLKVEGCWTNSNFSDDNYLCKSHKSSEAYASWVGDNRRRKNVKGRDGECCELEWISN